MNSSIAPRNHHIPPSRPARRRVRHELRPSLNLLEDRLLLAVAPQTYTVMNLNDSGPGSLRDAIASANADSYSSSAVDTIRFDPSLAGQTINLITTGDSTDFGSSALAITAPIVIDGSTAPGLTIRRSGAAGTPEMRIFYVGAPAKLTLNDLTIAGGEDASDNGGGGVLNFGNLTLTNDTFSANFSGGDGGGLESLGPSTLTDDTFSFNSADVSGGGVALTLASTNASATLTGDTFLGDNAGKSGGGLVTAFGTATLTGNKFTENSANDSGGGLASIATALSSTNDIFTDNSATGDGGGLQNIGVATLTGDTFTGNSATVGGGLANETQPNADFAPDFFTVTMGNDTFTGNSATFGGGLYDGINSTVFSSYDAFTGNSASINGGGLFNVGTATVTGDTFAGNGAQDLGGGFDNDSEDEFNINFQGSVTATNDTFFDNSAMSGGGLNNFGGATVTGDTFTNNNAENGCGLNSVGATTLYNTIVAGNFVTGTSYTGIGGDPNEISGTVTGSYNLIGDPESAGGLTNNSNGNTVGIDGQSPIPLSTIFATDSNGIPVLASYGGVTQTVALVPGSPAIDAASMSVPNFPFVDQRGFPIIGAPDIGAFESQGFTLTISGGNEQVTPVGQPFASPLTVTVTPINPIEPVNGGRIFFYAASPRAPARRPFSRSFNAPCDRQWHGVGHGDGKRRCRHLPGRSVRPRVERGRVHPDQRGIHAGQRPGRDQRGGPERYHPPADLAHAAQRHPSRPWPILGPQPSTSKVTVSLPSTMSPFPAIVAHLPAGLNFTLDGNGSSVNGNVTISQPGGADSTANDLNVTGNLQIQVGNAASGSVGSHANRDVTGRRPRFRPASSDA